MRIDAKSVKLFYAKDEFTVSMIYETYFGLLRHVAFEILGDKQEAEDCAQETFIKALNGAMPDSFNPNVFVSYLCKMAKNLALDRVRKRSTDELDEEQASQNEVLYQDDVLDLLRKELNSNEFDALTMHVCLGLDFIDVGLALGVSASSARGLAHRGKKKARALLKKEEWL